MKQMAVIGLRRLLSLNDANRDDMIRPPGLPKQSRACAPPTVSARRSGDPPASGRLLPGKRTTE